MGNLIELIKILRERTGAGMMDCKKALVENNEDVEKAIDWLREKGIAKAAKKSSRIAAEGATYVTYCDECHKTLIFEINCETDFVGKSPAFLQLVKDCSNAIMAADIHCIDCCKKAVEPLFNDAVIKMGEKLDFRRYEIINTTADNGVGTYIHMGGKISVAVVLEKNDPELAKGIAMTIAATNPSYISKNEVPEDVVARETAVQLESAKHDERLAGKPEAALAKIVEGKVNKALSDLIALEQEYVLDPSKKIKDALGSNKILKFVRYQVGEGLEKRVDNFAEEVMNQAK
jgi:elongation factor Ts